MEWVDVLGLEGLYEVSKAGYVRNALTKRQLTPVLRHHRWIFYLRRSDKAVTRSAQALVWESFNGPIPDGYFVGFKNQDKFDFRLDNLEIVTRSEAIHRGQRKLNKEISKDGPNVVFLMRKAKKAHEDLCHAKRSVTPGKISEDQIIAYSYASTQFKEASAKLIETLINCPELWSAMMKESKSQT